MDELYCVVTFNVTQHALVFEKILKKYKLDVKLMPVPRQLSASCGTAAYVSCEQKERIIMICLENKVPIDEFQELKACNKGNWFLKHLKKPD